LSSDSFLLNTKDNLDKFDARSDEGIFVRYSTRSKANKIFNRKIFTIEKYLHVTFDEFFPKSSHDRCIDDDDIIDMSQLMLLFIHLMLILTSLTKMKFLLIYRKLLLS